VPVHVQGTLVDGRYRILRHLGSGGMASVLLCQDERLGRPVAVKRLHAHQPEEVRRRFLREAKLGASLNHPNLVSVFDTATDDEGVLIVMEYVEGEALSAALRRGPLPADRVARMAAELGEALDHAHGHGVVHRDVKPANVLLKDNGVTKLADLGIASAADHTRITRSGVVLGTASYMAPEQLEGRKAGPRADVYALAAVCFEALTGERARQGRTPMEIARSIATGPPIDLRSRWPDAPARAAELLEQAMAEDPQDRPATAGALGKGLPRALGEGARPTAVTRRLEERTRPARFERHTAAAAVETRPARSPSRVWTAPRRKNRARLVGLGLAAVLLAIAVAAVVVVLGSGDGEDPASSRGAGAREEPRGASEQTQREPEREQRAQEPAPPPAAEETPPPTEEPAAPAPAEQAPQEQAPPEQSSGTDLAEGARLNNQGFQLMSEGRYEEAIPILQRAVDSFPAGTSDLNYAYALFNLGQSLRLAGRPDEAIPILEQRLEIPNQTGIVRRELELARRDAGRQ
jgi:tetratricopeptide (TPR) repeat protein